MKLFGRIDRALKPADAEAVKAALTSVFTDMGELAQSELQVGLTEWAMQRNGTAAK
jgi:hypothetical protein